MPQSQPSLAPETRLGPYVVVAPLGKGGMGEVYRAFDPRLEREVAIKVLPEALAGDSDLLRRFRDEALTASRLKHPSIVHIYDVGEQSSDEGPVVHYVAMELIEGRTFGSLLEGAALSWQQLHPLALQVLEGLEQAHRAGIVHRDLKTENLMVTSSGHAKILDFGLAKRLPLDDDLSRQGTLIGSATVPGATLGTIGYMSPEQAKGMPTDHRADQFSFGVVLYEMATGLRPFHRNSPAECLAALLTSDPRPLEERGTDVPRAVCRLIMRCLSKKPDDRFANTAELLGALASATGDQVAEPHRKSLGNVAPVNRRPLVGRNDELQQLQTHLARALGGHGGLLTLVGEPGVGKTRVAEEIQTNAREQGFVTLAGHCYEGEGAPPYSPWLEILERTAQISDPSALRVLLGDGGGEVAKIYPELRQLIPDLPAPLELPGEQSRPYLFRCFRDFIENSARQRPLLLVLEDLHWADDVTLLLLEHVAGQLSQMPVLIVGTYRDVDLEVSRPLAKTLQHLVRERLVEKMSLARLDESGVARMLDGLSGLETPADLVAKIHEETDGNPFFVEEVYLHLEEEGRLFDETGQWRAGLAIGELDVPEGVRLAVGRRVERLSREERSALTAAAVIGRRFTFELLERVVGGDADLPLEMIEHAEQLQLIEAATQKTRRGAGYRFSHELIRQTLLTTLSLPRRQRLHLRIAQGIEGMASDPARNASVLAHHFFQAGAAADEETVVRFLRLAGEQAVGSSAFEEALRHFEDALSILEDATPEERSETLRLRADAAFFLGRWQEAFSDWRELLPMLQQQESWASFTEVSLRASDMLLWLGDEADSAAVINGALKALPHVSQESRARLLGAVGALEASQYGDFERAREHTSEALALAEALGNRRLLGEVWMWRCFFFFLFMMRDDDSRAARRAIELLDDDDWKRVQTEGNCFWSATHLGRLEEVSDSRLERSGLLAQRIGHNSALVMLQMARCNRDWMTTGDIDAATRQRREIADFARETDNPTLLKTYEGLQDRSFFWRGDWETARDRARSREADSSPGAWKGGILDGLPFLYECYLGDEVGALSALEDLKDFLPSPSSTHSTFGSWYALMHVVEGLAVLGKNEQAASFYPLIKRALETGTKVTQDAEKLIEHIAGMSAAAGEQWERAEAHFEEALRQADEIPCVPERPEVRRSYAGMLIGRDAPGDRKRARKLLEEAVAGYREMGMPRHERLAESQLQQTRS